MASSQCCRLLVAGTPQLRHWYYNMFVLAPGIGHDIPSRQDRSQRYTSTAQCKRLMHTHAFAGKEVHQALDIPKSGIFTGKLTRVQKTLKDTPKCPNFDRFGMDFEFFLLDFWLLLCGFNEGFFIIIWNSLENIFSCFSLQIDSRLRKFDPGI